MVAVVVAGPAFLMLTLFGMHVVERWVDRPVSSREHREGGSRPVHPRGMTTVAVPDLTMSVATGQQRQSQV